MGSQQLASAIVAARSSRNRSVQEVADAASISATYVRKLEDGVVNDPSPRVLRQLAQALEVPYRALMDAAGYLSGRDDEFPGSELRSDLTEEERQAVLAFADFLVARRRP